MSEPLSGIQHELRDAHSQLSSSWQDACVGWNDATRRRFEARFWDELSTSTPRFLAALAELEESLDNACKELF